MDSRVRSASERVWRGFLGDGEAADIEFSISFAASSDSEGLEVSGGGDDG